jgi:hypothetical protein
LFNIRRSIARRTIAAGVLFWAGIALSSTWGWTAEVYRPQEVLTAAWGSEAGQFGLLEQAEGVGPQSLCADSQGHLYILDLVNRRVQVFSPSGELLDQTACGTLAHDVRLGDGGEIYLLAPYHGLVEQYDAAGTFVTSWPLSPDLGLIDGLRIDGRDVILRTAAQTEHVIARAGEALQPKQQIETAAPGYGGRHDDRRYGTRWVSSHLGLVLRLDATGHKIGEIKVKTSERLGSLIYLGEDLAGHIYLRAELLGLPRDESLRVLKYDPQGHLLAQFDLPANDFTFVYRDLYLDEDGDIYQLLTGPDGVRVVRWAAGSRAGEGR